MVWVPYNEPIDYVLFEGQATPGISVVEKSGVIVTWDKIRGYGYGGAVSRFTGTDLSDFNVRCQLWTDEDWQDYENFLPLVASPPRGVRPKAKDIWHPFLEALKIKSITTKGISQPEPILDGSVFEVVIPCLQFGKPRTMYGQPKGATSKSDDPVDRMIELRTQRLNELANG